MFFFYGRRASTPRKGKKWPLVLLALSSPSNIHCLMHVTANVSYVPWHFVIVWVDLRAKEPQAHPSQNSAKHDCYIHNLLFTPISPGIPLTLSLRLIRGLSTFLTAISSQLTLIHSFHMIIPSQRTLLFHLLLYGDQTTF